MYAVIKTRHDELRRRLVDGVHMFQAIRYAAPPFGARRLRPPQPVGARRGVRDALTFGAESPQLRP